jgi:hypothetical protein
VGVGLAEPNHPREDPASARDIIEAPAEYRVTYMGGTPARWRTLTADTRKEAEWADVLKMMDVVQPWMVGRYRDLETVDKWKYLVLTPDLALAARNHRIYMPVVFPGFFLAQPETGVAS